MSLVRKQGLAQSIKGIHGRYQNWNWGAFGAEWHQCRAIQRDGLRISFVEANTFVTR